ncbi:MAG TPA: kelch repeat-containing protein, partial [Planctomycetota bacterium]|nr:kelch repeat-containing protein [Planctomycetota bacterium]
DGTTWTQRNPNPAPLARSRHTLVFDAARGVCRLFGGYNIRLQSDTWEWDGTTWRQVATSGAPPRMYHAMAHQDARGTSLVFGGYDLSVPLADTWEFVTGPPCATPVAFGCETPHCDGAPRVSAPSCARVGNGAFALEIANAIPDEQGVAGGLLFLSAQAAAGQSLPCSSSVAQRLCFNVVPPGIGFAVPIDARGRGRLPLPIPGDPVLAGGTVFGQFVNAHPGRGCACALGPGAGFTSSRGIRISLQ